MASSTAGREGKPFTMAASGVTARAGRGRAGRLRRPVAGRGSEGPPGLRRVASNFAMLCAAEVVCRGVSVLTTLSLPHRLRSDGYGRVEFVFGTVFWLVLIVRDGFETIATREVARHPRITRRLVERVVAAKLGLAAALYLGLVGIGLLTQSDPSDVRLFALYGLLLFSTALGIDFVFRGRERMGLIAVSLLVRTAVYCAGVLLTVHEPGQIARVPLWLVAGEAAGIGLVWLVHAREWGRPRPDFSLRFLRLTFRRGRTVALIQFCQAVLVTADLLVVGSLTSWSNVGLYGAPYRMVSVLMAFGLIFQQVTLPALSRGWRRSDASGRRILDLAVRALMMGFLPVAVGATVLSGPIMRLLLSSEYEGMAVVLAIGVWRAPLLSLAFLYQTALIARNREAAGVRLLVGGAAVTVPSIAIGYMWMGFIGASTAVLGLGLVLAVAGFLCLAREGQAPAPHHHVVRPLIASAAMLPVCLAMGERSVPVVVLAGGTVYVVVLAAIGGFHGFLRHRVASESLAVDAA